MSSSSSDSASRIREQANKTLLERAQAREKEAHQAMRAAETALSNARQVHKASAELADAQLKELCVAFDTLIEFILLNHGSIPDRLVEIIAARQEQRILDSLPKADFINQGVQPTDEVSTGAAAAGANGMFDRPSKSVSELRDELLSQRQLRGELLDQIQKG